MWEGGLAIIVGIVLAHRSRLPLLTSLDVAAPGSAIEQTIGRWGNFFNEEAFGTPADLPWKLYISPPHRPP